MGWIDRFVEVVCAFRHHPRSRKQHRPPTNLWERVRLITRRAVKALGLEVDVLHKAPALAALGEGLARLGQGGEGGFEEGVHQLEGVKGLSWKKEMRDSDGGPLDVHTLSLLPSTPPFSFSNLHRSVA